MIVLESLRLRAVALTAVVALSTGCVGAWDKSRVSRQPIGHSVVGSFAAHNQPEVRLSDYRGKAVVLVFGYTQCPDICPTTLQHWQSVFSTFSEAEAARAQFVFVTVDPARDTPELLSQYMNFFNPSFAGLHANKKTLDTLLEELHIFARKVPSRTPGQYSMDHSGSAFLIDSTGVLIEELPFGTGVEQSQLKLGQLISST